jgi:hypothetical protein
MFHMRAVIQQKYMYRPRWDAKSVHELMFNFTTQEPTAMPLKRKRGLFTNPSCVLLLKNMVGRGEVDAELELEVC